MNLRLLHRRLAVLMALAGLLAFAGGAGLEPAPALLAAGALLLALVWHPAPAISARMERVWLPLAALLLGRVLLHALAIRDDVLAPVVDLLYLLLAAEALRSLDAPNDTRLYALSFALILAATAYRPGVLFLAAFVAFVAFAVLALMVGHLRRTAERHGVRTVPLGRRLIWTTLGLSSVILAVSAVVFLLFPRVSRGWAGRGNTLATPIAGFSEEVSLGEHGTIIQGNPRIVLRAEFPGGLPPGYQGLHWRGRSYDRFDGVRWTRSRGLPPSGGPTRWYTERWRAPRLQQRIYAAPLDVRVLFALHPVLDVEAESGVQPLFDNAGDLLYWGAGAPAYSAWSPSAPPPPEDLRGAERGYVPPGRYFLQLPELDPRVRLLADSLTAGLATRYERAAAIQEHLRSFRYTRELPARASETSLEHFLFVRRAGHCEYFSTAMVVLLRAAGIEARNVNGFLGGEWNEFGGYLAVTQNQAHSWVEVWFPEYGWVTFDPTPAGAGEGGRATAWFWPGRIFLDGLQHRWNKWVLDYDPASQGGFFQGLPGLLANSRLQEAAARAERDVQRSLWAPLLLAALVAGGAAWARRGRRRLPRETQMYLRLRWACERAGVRVSPGLTPLALVRRVREARRPAAGAAAELVELYLRARYGGERLSEGELCAMVRALRQTRLGLARKP